METWQICQCPLFCTPERERGRLIPRWRIFHIAQRGTISTMCCSVCKCAHDNMRRSLGAYEQDRRCVEY